MTSYLRPTHIFKEAVFKNNLLHLNSLNHRCNLRVLLALKGYNPLHSAHMVNIYTSGVAVSSLYEARSAKEYYTGEIHTYCPAYEEDTFEELMSYSSHVVFNSKEDLIRFAPRVPKGVLIDIRVNIQHQSQKKDVFDGYNPNKPFSRFGITAAEMDYDLLDKYGVSGVHFHAMNSQGADELVDCIDTLEFKFPTLLNKVSRLNMGGGHLVCSPGYKYDTVCDLVKRLEKKYNIALYMEPSEHVYTGVGVLKARVLSIMQNEVPIAILNVSAKNHMPDILECPTYDVDIQEGIRGRGTAKHSYILGGNTCLTGDVIGDYSFPHPLEVGDVITFLDQTSYTSAQAHYFNGVPQPDKVLLGVAGNIKLVKEDSYKRYLLGVE